MNQKENIQLPSKPIQANVDLLIERERVGLVKYGVTLGDAELTHAQLLQHGLEEALDLANYLQTAIATETENEKYKRELGILLRMLKDFRDRQASPKLSTAEPMEAFRDLLFAYELGAQRRGIRT
jgi:hypothetical protein